jgi:hypothetical protein
MQSPDEPLQTALTALHEMAADPLSTDGVALQELLAAAVTAYAARCAAGDAIPPFPSSRPTSLGGDPAAAKASANPDVSSVCVAVSAMLDTVSVEVFELAMWQAWTGATS